MKGGDINVEDKKNSLIKSKKRRKEIDKMSDLFAHPDFLGHAIFIFTFPVLVFLYMASRK